LVNRYFFLIFIVIGIGSLIGSVYMAVGLLDFLNSAVKTQATIVDVVQIQSHDGYSQFPVFQFFDLNGIDVVARGNSDFSDYTIGQEMEIYYDPGNPSGLVHQENLTMWAPAALFLIVGLIFVGVGSVFFLKYDDFRYRNY